MNMSPIGNMATSKLAPSPVNLAGHRLGLAGATMGEGSALGEVGSSFDGRKRPWKSSLRTPPERSVKKKLSPIALKARAALESDSSSGDERVSKIPTVDGGRQSLAADAGVGGEYAATAEGGGQSSPGTGNGAIGDGGIVELTKTSNITAEKDHASGVCTLKSHDGEKGGSIPSEDTGEVTTAAIQNRKQPGTADNIAQMSGSTVAAMLGEPDVKEKLGVASTAEDDVSRGDKCEPADASSSTNDDTAEDKSDYEDAVRPHPSTSEYNDLLPFMLSTPFDRRSMLGLHNLKEGLLSHLDAEESETIRNSFLQSKMVSSQMDHVPIVPQKQYIKFARERQRIHRQENTSGPMSSSDISAEVSSFLVQQGHHVKKPAVPSSTPALSNEEQTLFQYPPPPQQDLQTQQVQQALLTQQLLLSHLNAQQSVPMGYFGQSSYDSMLHSYTALQQQQQLNEWLMLQQRLAAVRNNADPFAVGLQNAYDEAAVRALLLSANNGHAQDRISPLAAGQIAPTFSLSEAMSKIQSTGASQPKLASAAAQFGHSLSASMHSSVSSTTAPSMRQSPPQSLKSATEKATEMVQSKAGNATNNVMAAYQAQVDNPATGPKIAMASKEIKASEMDAQITAMMPVAFGFHVDDGGASKALAVAAAGSWKVQGQKAAKEAAKPKPRSSPSRKNRRSVGGTPKGAKTPRGSTTPKTPRTPAVLLSTKAAPNLPEGWVCKTFRRTSGKTAGGTDAYFFSPKEEIKFRSMKNCNTFIGILNEPGVDGNEVEARKVYKERGHRF